MEEEEKKMEMEFPFEKHVFHNRLSQIGNNPNPIIDHQEIPPPVEKNNCNCCKGFLALMFVINNSVYQYYWSSDVLLLNAFFGSKI